MIYKVKRFSILNDKLFSLSKARNLVKLQEANLVSHILIYLSVSDDNTNLNHWKNTEIPTFIYNATRGYSKNEYSNMSYIEMFPVYLMNEISSRTVTEVESNLRSERCTKDMIDYSSSDDYKSILTNLVSRLDRIKDSSKRLPNSNSRSDRDLIISVLDKLRSDYKLYERFNYI